MDHGVDSQTRTSPRRNDRLRDVSRSRIPTSSSIGLVPNGINPRTSLLVFGEERQQSLVRVPASTLTLAYSALWPRRLDPTVWNVYFCLSVTVRCYGNVIIRT
ncbi:hypothetical protein J6590_073223 [Homalodisca vitripennis]|nr:hypothetical protein J6590_073223 [Homalodisca vitripennis]